MFKRWKPVRFLKQLLYAMIGLPDYQTYLNHIRQFHPHKKPLSYEAFFLSRQHARYNNKYGKGCC